MCPTRAVPGWRVLAVIALVGCGVFGPDGCDLCTTSTTVQGQVTSAAGPVSGVVLDARAYAGICADSVRSGDSAISATTTTTGLFALRVQSLLAPAEHCIALRARGPTSESWRDTVVTILGVRFESDYPKRSSSSVARNVTLTHK